MEKTYQQIIEELLEELLKKLDFEAKIEVSEQETDSKSFFCRLTVEKDQNFLIGQYGTNLTAIQHILRILLRKKITEKIQIIVDVNDYFLEKKALLEKEAKKAEEEALNTNISVTLRPMLPYERKIVHSFFADNDEVITESVGTGEARKVVIHPKKEGK
ncbi:MAG: hypothetical protein PHH40_03890 [Candidatus Moranbacteria bacterium]|nr:hypothetical protein [Candidatus Moranbacteria bacterium]MDD3964619.1 hypothetical protein [Candidatus Moranbacteria bacterium]